MWAVLLLAIAGAGYAGGRLFSGLDQSYLAALEEMRTALEREGDALRRQRVNLQIEKTVGVQATDALREDIKSLRDEQAKLRQELVFYRSLMAPAKVRRGLQVASFELFARRSGSFGYHLLLTQVTNQRARLRGKVWLTVAGELAGEAQVLPLTELAEVDGYPLSYRFRYFQDLAGELRLPPGFQPTEVRVVVEGRGSKKLERSFLWRDALAAGSG